jgi:hypothetical protein
MQEATNMGLYDDAVDVGAKYFGMMPGMGFSAATTAGVLHTDEYYQEQDKERYASTGSGVVTDALDGADYHAGHAVHDLINDGDVSGAETEAGKAGADLAAETTLHILTDGIIG